MASAGRILIMPKGNFDSSVTYEMLDLVFYNGTSWIAKKTVVGIEPSETHNEYWHKLCESVDLSEVEGRIAALENQLVNATSLDDIDLSTYATKGEVASVSAEVDALEQTVGGLSEQVNSFVTSNMKIASGSYIGTETYGVNAPNSLTFDFVPKVVFIDSEEKTYGLTLTWVYGITRTSIKPINSGGGTILNFSLDGNKLSWYNENYASWQLNTQGKTYYWVAIG